ncbi:MAG TPA: DUF72 domain-containing protein [Candidatus Limnocylindrales bacterium]|nr:DUF72 domain-containing protein [Candidatus Limnocylindrales bacterium]
MSAIDGQPSAAAAHLHIGTSGFSYPDWRPRFYPPSTPPSRFLAEYATRLGAVELNATFRRRPTRSAIEGWLRATPPAFRFAVKAQRGSAIRALMGSPTDSVAWLTEPLPAFGDRLGAVLFRIPREIRRDGPWNGGDAAAGDRALAAILDAWPSAIPLVVELQDPSWHVDETFAALTNGRATLCATDRDDGDEPTLRRTAGRLYLRLRREDYDGPALDRWAARIRPFLEAGDEVFVFFRHDPVGHAGELAQALQARLAG